MQNDKRFEPIVQHRENVHSLPAYKSQERQDTDFDSWLLLSNFPNWPKVTITNQIRSCTKQFLKYCFVLNYGVIANSSSYLALNKLRVNKTSHFTITYVISLWL